MGVTRLPSLAEVSLVELNPTRGSEIQRTGPCIAISPDKWVVGTHESPKSVSSRSSRRSVAHRRGA